MEQDREKLKEIIRRVCLQNGFDIRDQNEVEGLSSLQYISTLIEIEDELGVEMSFDALERNLFIDEEGLINVLLEAELDLSEDEDENEAEEDEEEAEEDDFIENEDDLWNSFLGNINQRKEDEHEEDADEEKEN